MTRRRPARALALAGGLALILGGCGRPATGVAIRQAWARATPGTGTMGAVYFTLVSGSGDRLLRVTVPDSIAAGAELHEVTRDALGRLGMRPVAAIALPAGVTTRLEPGGRHVMLIGLRHPLVAGERVALQLAFARAAPETASALVRQP